MESNTNYNVNDATGGGCGLAILVVLAIMFIGSIWLSTIH